MELLFGQYKYMSGSKLDVANYATCRSKYLAKQAVHHSGQFYRDQELSIPIAPLEKKQYSSSKKNSRLTQKLNTCILYNSVICYSMYLF